MTDFDETIVDASKPNAGRIYDYLIGGQSHFKIDREMAENLKKQAPFIPKLAIMTRWFVSEGTKRALKQGFTHFLDYASGLPTINHIHTITPPEAKIIYSDIDPVTVKLGKNIIKNKPNIRYEACDAAFPENLLDSDILKELFKGIRKITISYNGIFWFLRNEQISHAMKVLYEWVDKGSILYFTDYDLKNETEELKQVIELYRSMNTNAELRSKEELIDLVKPWKLKEPGILPMEKWRGLSDTLKETEKWGGGGIMGGFLIK